MAKIKVLFIDRDGTIIKEPPTDYQVDSLEKLEFIPKVIRNLYKISTSLDYQLVMVTNQDGLGTQSFPEEDFLIPHNKMLTILDNEGITFDEILIDRSFPEDNLPTRKPRTGLLKAYFNKIYDLENSFVIGDRETDLELAKNLGCFGIAYGDLTISQNLADLTKLKTKDWDEIYSYLKSLPRSIVKTRKSRETDITLSLNLDGTGYNRISTGLHFFDHMLEQIAKYGEIDINIEIKGDLEVDQHHTIEDCGIVFGEAISEALGNKRGIERFGFLLPMDDSLAEVAIDFSGRGYLQWDLDFTTQFLGDFPTEMFKHFFRSFTESSKSTLSIKCKGENNHHKIESVFKAFGKSLRDAISRDGTDSIPSTKGFL